MKLLFLFLATQLSAILFTENFHETTSITLFSLVSLISFSGAFIQNILNYKNK